MTKADLVEEVAKVTELTRKDSEVIVDTLFESVIKALRTGDKLEVRGFGSFVTKKRAAKLGRLISLNKTITIPEHYIPAFRPAQNFIDQVKNNYKPRAETTTDGELEAKP